MKKRFSPKLSTTVLGILVIFLSFSDGSGESIMTLISAGLHEMGHIAAMMICGINIRKITVTPLGFEIVPGRLYRSFYEEIAVSLAGCMINLVTFLLFRASGGMLGLLAETSLILGIMNILPIRCLDGGEALNAFFNLRMLPDRAEMLGQKISFITLLFMWIPAAYIFLITGCNYSLFIMSSWLFCRIFF